MRGAPAVSNSSQDPLPHATTKPGRKESPSGVLSDMGISSPKNSDVHRDLPIKAVDWKDLLMLQSFGPLWAFGILQVAVP